jgi:hypothetical protein
MAVLRSTTPPHRAWRLVLPVDSSSTDQNIYIKQVWNRDGAYTSILLNPARIKWRNSDADFHCEGEIRTHIKSLISKYIQGSVLVRS